jgi:hypothetical protein
MMRGACARRGMSPIEGVRDGRANCGGMARGAAIARGADICGAKRGADICGAEMRGAEKCGAGAGRAAGAPPPPRWNCADALVVASAADKMANIAVRMCGRNTSCLRHSRNAHVVSWLRPASATTWLAQTWLAMEMTVHSGCRRAKGA